MALPIIHRGWPPLRVGFRVVRLGKIDVASVAKLHRPAIAVPRNHRAIEFRRSLRVPEDRIRVSRSLRSARHVDLVPVLEIEVRVGVGKSRAGWTDVVGMIASDSK